MSDHHEIQVDREGIHIDRELAEAVAIEEDLDANLADEYVFPDPARRRTSGWVMVAAAAMTVATVDGGWPVAAGMLLLAGWLFLSAWSLGIDEVQALSRAASAVPFPVGHAAASLRFRGWRSRPVWSVVLYSATEPPDERALVVIDAVNGELLGDPYVEAVTTV
ncbi:MAG: hypothetical protein ACE5F5_04455 [Acidimicrobiia bacterium]